MATVAICDFTANLFHKDDFSLCMYLSTYISISHTFSVSFSLLNSWPNLTELKNIYMSRCEGGSRSLACTDIMHKFL